MPCARFVSEDGRPPDPLRERALALVRHATAPVPTAALRAALGVRKQTLLAVLHRLAGEDVIRRAGRDGWTIPPRAVPDQNAIGGNRTTPAG